jgi:hypothetical protein
MSCDTPNRHAKGSRSAAANQPALVHSSFGVAYEALMASIERVRCVSVSLQAHSRLRPYLAMPPQLGDEHGEACVVMGSLDNGRSVRCNKRSGRGRA